MANVTLFRRPSFAVFLSLALTACSTDGLAPSARIDSDAQVSSVQPMGSRTQRRRDAAYPSADMPVGAVSSGNDIAGQGIVAIDPMPSQRLPMIDSDEAIQQASLSGRQATNVPPEGVNMDAMLGVGQESQPVVGLAEEQSLDIAEGNASQPVVGGIGEDSVRQLAGPRTLQEQASIDPAYDPDLPPLSPEKMAEEEARKAQFLEQQQRVMLKRQQTGREQQVAFLPRANNPMSEPDFTGQMPSSEISCRNRLKKLGVEFRDVARISNGRSCGIDYPIELSGLSGGIDVKPAVKLNCEVTEAFALWVKNELAPSARYRYMSGVKTIKPLGGYSCRTMNSRRGNPMSEHAHGNAIDVGKFVLKSGKEIDVRKPGFFAFREKGLLKAVRSDSCKYFNTVLGPGSDPYHKDHFHFDLRERKSGYRHCD